MARIAFRTDLPDQLAVLAELALDLRWTWSHAGDDLWRMINPEVWERTRNPWTLLQDVSRERLETLVRDPAFREELRNLIGLRQRYLSEPSWYAQHYSEGEVERVAYFSMEFGLGEACRSTPAASACSPAIPEDCQRPRRAGGRGRAALPGGVFPSDPRRRRPAARDVSRTTIRPACRSSRSRRRPAGGCRSRSNSPGGRSCLRVWQAQVGRVALYLLDSNDPMNSPADRGITGKLYGGG